MKKTLSALAVAAVPALASAQQLDNIEQLIVSVSNIINLLVPIVFTLALLYFFWGLANYILKAGEEKEEGKNIMIWGIVALFVMASVWGIVGFIQTALDVDEGSAPTVQLPNSSGGQNSQQY